MIYVFDDIEEMQACCGCPVTPDGVRTLSVINNLTKNFGVNRGNMNAGVIDIVSTTPNLLLPKPIALPPQIGTLPPSGWACDPSWQFGPIIGVTELTDGVPGLRAWMTNTEGNVPVPASRTLVKGTSVSEFQSTVDPGPELENFCLFLITNGSGTGACSCGSGDSLSEAPFACNAPRQFCGTACVDTSTDSYNCGNCGHYCGPLSFCASGQCVT